LVIGDWWTSAHNGGALHSACCAHRFQDLRSSAAFLVYHNCDALKTVPRPSLCTFGDYPIFGVSKRPGPKTRWVPGRRVYPNAEAAMY
jgi:hypothetical protein